MPHPLLAGASRSPIHRLAELAEQCAELTDDPLDVIDAAQVYALMDKALMHLSIVRSVAEADLCRQVERRKLQDDDHTVGPFTVRRSRSTQRTNWDHDRVGQLALTRIMRDLELPTTHVYGAWDRLKACAGIGYWKGDRSKGTGLFALGLDKDDYCDQSHAERAKVILP